MLLILFSTIFKIVSNTENLDVDICDGCSKVINPFESLPLVYHSYETFPPIYHVECLASKYKILLNQLRDSPAELSEFMRIVKNTSEYEDFVINLKMYINNKYHLNLFPTLIPQESLDEYLKEENMYEGYMIFTKSKDRIDKATEILHQFKNKEESLKIFSHYNIIKCINEVILEKVEVMPADAMKNIITSIEYGPIITFIKYNTIEIKNIELKEVDLINELIKLMDIKVLLIQIKSENIHYKINYTLDFSAIKELRIFVYIENNNVDITKNFLTSSIFKRVDYFILFQEPMIFRNIQNLLITFQDNNFKDLHLFKIYLDNIDELIKIIDHLNSKNLYSLSIVFEEFNKIKTNLSIRNYLYHASSCNKYIDKIYLKILEDINLIFFLKFIDIFKTHSHLNFLHLNLGNRHLYNDADVFTETKQSLNLNIQINILVIEFFQKNFTTDKSTGLKTLVSGLMHISKNLVLNNIFFCEIKNSIFSPDATYDAIQSIEFINVAIITDFLIDFFKQLPNVQRVVFDNTIIQDTSINSYGKNFKLISIDILETSGIYLYHFQKLINIFSIQVLIIKNFHYWGIAINSPKRPDVFIKTIEYRYTITNKSDLEDKEGLKKEHQGILKSFLETNKIGYDTLNIILS